MLLFYMAFLKTDNSVQNLMKLIVMCVMSVMSAKLGFCQINIILLSLFSAFSGKDHGLNEKLSFTRYALIGSARKKYRRTPWTYCERCVFNFLQWIFNLLSFACDAIENRSREKHRAER